MKVYEIKNKSYIEPSKMKLVRTVKDGVFYDSVFCDGVEITSSRTEQYIVHSFPPWCVIVTDYMSMIRITTFDGSASRVIPWNEEHFYTMTNVFGGVKND